MARGGRNSENAGQKSRENPEIFQRKSSGRFDGLDETRVTP